jgi:hypothetical protein
VDRPPLLRMNRDVPGTYPGQTWVRPGYVPDLEQ